MLSLIIRVMLSDVKPVTCNLLGLTRCSANVVSPLLCREVKDPVWSRLCGKNECVWSETKETINEKRWKMMKYMN